MDYNVLKYILIGDSGVGKSSILMQYTNKKLDTYHIPTIGVDYGTNIINHDNIKYKLQIWDTSGQELYRQLIKRYYKEVHCVIIVYDITDRKTFDNIPSWMNDINDIIANSVIILIGNKLDNQYNRQVSKEDGIEIAKKYNMLFMEISATNPNDIKELFAIATNIYASKMTATKSENLYKTQYNRINYECCVFL